jgi:hypothetical protein
MDDLLLEYSPLRFPQKDLPRPLLDKLFADFGLASAFVSMLVNRLLFLMFSFFILFNM